MANEDQAGIKDMCFCSAVKKRKAFSSTVRKHGVLMQSYDTASKELKEVGRLATP
ncbi:hypothetical protein [Halodesulfovibrio sp.]|jgi:hypothetical protein|uniref:hypothetical protein n=1 Tax=Halodesulfovibrio sp. TaxID=1912772 RepID=UPI0025CE812D|nr:hypothetical protein [Halodesulfovibrio sp.]MCT4535018.1 hypothetical protein [Halodesulfovibrio sp.]